MNEFELKTPLNTKQKNYADQIKTELAKSKVVALTGSYGSGKTNFIRESFFNSDLDMSKNGKYIYYSALEYRDDAGIQAMISGKRNNQIKRKNEFQNKFWEIFSLYSVVIMGITATLAASLSTVNSSMWPHSFWILLALIFPPLFNISCSGNQKIIVIDDIDRLDFDTVHKILSQTMTKNNNKYIVIFDHSNIRDRYFEKFGNCTEGMSLNIEKYYDYEFRMSEIISEDDYVTVLRKIGVNESIINFQKLLLSRMTNYRINIRDVVRCDQMYSKINKHREKLNMNEFQLIFFVFIKTIDPSFYEYYGRFYMFYNELLGRKNDPNRPELLSYKRFVESELGIHKLDYKDFHVSTIEIEFVQKTIKYQLHEFFSYLSVILNEGHFMPREKIGVKPHISLNRKGENLFFDFDELVKTSEIVEKIDGFITENITEKNKDSLVEYSCNKNYVVASAAIVILNNIKYPLGRWLMKSDMDYGQLIENIIDHRYQLSFDDDFSMLSNVYELIKLGDQIYYASRNLASGNKWLSDGLKYKNIWNTVFEINIPKFNNNYDTSDMQQQKFALSFINWHKKYADTAFKFYKSKEISYWHNFLKANHHNSTFAFISCISNANSEIRANSDFIELILDVLEVNMRVDGYDEMVAGVQYMTLTRIFKENKELARVYAHAIKKNINIIYTESINGNDKYKIFPVGKLEEIVYEQLGEGYLEKI